MAVNDYKGGYADGQVYALDEVVDALERFIDEDEDYDTLVNSLQNLVEFIGVRVDSLRRERD